MRPTTALAALALLLAASALPAAADDRDAIVTWLEQGPSFTAPTAGAVLARGDAAIAHFLPPGYAEEFDFDGVRLEIAPSMDYAPHPVYQRATAKFAGQATLGSDGALEHYVAGLPFDAAHLDAVDPAQAGLMVAWNQIHRWQYYGWHSPRLVMNYLVPAAAGGTLNDGLEGGGHVERYVTQDYHRVYLSHLAMLADSDYRVDVDGADTYLYKDYIEFFEPFDVQGTRFVIERALDPHEPDQVNSYMPGERRVRRLSAEERADRFMGSDLTMDDFEGFSGQVLDYTWRYLGQRRVLAVVASRAPLISFFGPKSRVPDDRWQLRRTYVVEMVSKWDGHPYASKILFVDAQTWNVTVALAFNRDHRVWRIISPLYWLPGPAANADGQGDGNDDAEAALAASVPHWAATIAIDVIADTATISRTTTPTELPTMKPSQIRRRFSVSNLTGGR